MMKFIILLMTVYVINSHTLTRQNWSWIQSQGQLISGNPVGLIENIESSLPISKPSVSSVPSPPSPPPIPSIDLNGSLDSLINQLNNLISLRNERRQQITQWNQSLFDKQSTIGNGIIITFDDEINYDDDPWLVVISRLITAVVAVITKAVAANIIV